MFTLASNALGQDSDRGNFDEYSGAVRFIKKFEILGQKSGISIFAKEVVLTTRWHFNFCIS